MKLPLILSLLASCAVVVGVTSAAEHQEAVASAGQTEWTFRYAGQPVMVYAFAPWSYKPYVKVLSTIEGEDLLRDAPHDHLHHHALMYAIRVNGLNFWEEISGSGVEKPVKTDRPELGHTAAGLPEARLHQVLHWLAPQDAFLPDSAAVALLIEDRTLTLTVDPGSKEVALQWQSRFEVGGKTNEVTLTGSTYFGVGMRFREDLDGVAVHRNAGGKPDLSNNRQDVTPHAWGSVAFEKPGHPATITVYGDPKNAHGDATFFTMRTPFAYLSATQGLHETPLVYKSGDRFELNYLVTVKPELLAPEAITARGQKWQPARTVLP